MRTGLPGVGTGGTDLFEVRTRVASAVQYVSPGRQVAALPPGRSSKRVPAFSA